MRHLNFLWIRCYRVLYCVIKHSCILILEANFGFSPDPRWITFPGRKFPMDKLDLRSHKSSPTLCSSNAENILKNFNFSLPTRAQNNCRQVDRKSKRERNINFRYSEVNTLLSSRDYICFVLRGKEISKFILEAIMKILIPQNAPQRRLKAESLRR